MENRRLDEELFRKGDAVTGIPNKEEYMVLFNTLKAMGYDVYSGQSASSFISYPWLVYSDNICGAKPTWTARRKMDYHVFKSYLDGYRPHKDDMDWRNKLSEAFNNKIKEL